jgi:ribonuclease-3
VSTFLFKDKLNHIVEHKLYLSPKSHLQEIAQDRFKMLPIYTIVSENGPEHNKSFQVSVTISDKQYGVGEGKSKKQAEEQAARLALEQLITK